MGRNKRHAKTVEQPPRPPIRRWPVILVVLACVLALVGWFGKRMQAVHNARLVIEQHGGKAYESLDGLAHLGPISFAGKPLTDADMAEVGPAILAAGGTHELDLTDTRITDAGLAHLKGLDNLSTLRLDGAKVAGPGLVHFAEMAKDSEVNVVVSLTRTLVDDAGLAHFASLTTVNELDLSQTKVTGPGLTHLRNMKVLNSLTLNGCPLTDAGLANLSGWTTLYHLSLANTPLSDAALPHVRQLNQLQGLALNGTKITDDGLKTLHGWDALTSLALADTAVTPAGILSLKHQNKLISLNLDGTTVTDDTLRQMAGWTTLHSLSLERTGITDTGLLYLADLPNLQRILLRDSKFTEAGVAALRARKPHLLADR